LIDAHDGHIVYYYSVSPSAKKAARKAKRAKMSRIRKPKG